jgi:PhnB protein
MEDPMNDYRTVTPYLCVPDADLELTFLKAAFGAAEVECQRNADSTIMHAEIRIGDSLVMLGQPSDQGKYKGAAIYLWVPDVDAVYAKALAAGAASESAPEDKPYGHRNAGVTDRNGVTWWIASPLSTAPGR